MPTRSRTAVCSATTPAAGVLDGHLPAAEVGHLRAERDVPVVQGRVPEGGHGRARYRCRLGQRATATPE